MKVLIVGASGLVGSNCLLHFKEKEYDVTGTHLSFPYGGTVYYNPLNPADPENINIAESKPEVIIHCAALTNVDYCENNPSESYERTVVSAQNIATIARETGARIIYLSTDYVFDGQSGPYIESDQVHPLNIYGKHKLEAERLVLNQSSANIIIRVTNVYGDEPRGKNFVSRIVTAIRKNERLTLSLPFDQFATPVNALDIARVIHKLLVNQSAGIYHIGSTDYFNRVQLFRKVLQYFPEYDNYQLQVLSTKALIQPALRPLRGGLLSAKFIQENPEFNFTNVDDYLKKIQN